jgi:hypothetical protein
VVYLCKALFDRFVSRSEQNTSWPYSDIPETVFARTILSDGSGVSFQALLKSKKELNIGNDYTPDPKQLTQLWQNYNHFWEKQSTGGFPTSFDDLSESQRLAWGLVFAYHRCLSEVLEGHQFFVTEKRFVGLAPLVSKQGDVIALIDSLRTPVVLRSVTTSGNRGYLLVGPCYVHGVMYGETPPGSAGPLAQEGEYIPLI